MRLILAGVGLVSLLMSAAIPHAFGSDAVLFAGAYVCMQVGRNVAAMCCSSSAEPLRPVFERLVAWSLLSAPLWIAGAFIGGPARPALWGPALALDLIAPLVGYRDAVSGPVADHRDWEVEGGHFADRFQAFVIIALGESIVITGATASADGLSAHASSPWRSRSSSPARSGGCTSARSPKHSQRRRSPSPTTPAASPATPTPTCTCRSSPGSSWSRSATTC